jgi:replication-associated recombination protein RarA
MNERTTVTQLTLKYQPKTFAQFAGLTRPIILMRRLASEPWESAWLFLGPPGVGKTTLGHAVASHMDAQLHEIPSRLCGLDSVLEMKQKFAYVPMTGKGWYVALINEADRMTRPAQEAFLSVLDPDAMPSQVVWIFTANDTAALEDRFISRCRTVRFTTDQMEAPALALMRRIWKKEAKGKEPDFTAILQQNGCNLRGALNDLELELLDPGAGLDPETPARPKKPANRVEEFSQFFAAMKEANQ